MKKPVGYSRIGIEKDVQALGDEELLETYHETRDKIEGITNGGVSSFDLAYFEELIIELTKREG